MSDNSSPSQNLCMGLPTTPPLINLSGFLLPTPNHGPSLNSPKIMNTSIPLEPIPDNDPTFSNLLSGLQMENPGRDRRCYHTHNQSLILERKEGARRRYCGDKQKLLRN
ncbi:hypothetical protein KEM48_007827 [Puccinia striiformis f. sp. tritici PST-130]|nr:hypothetical protein KEM48_007827 [Puccinia striiformis f. sp. tritici PST-130]